MSQICAYNLDSGFLRWSKSWKRHWSDIWKCLLGGKLCDIFNILEKSWTFLITWEGKTIDIFLFAQNPLLFHLRKPTNESQAMQWLLWDVALQCLILVRFVILLRVHAANLAPIFDPRTVGTNSQGFACACDVIFKHVGKMTSPCQADLCSCLNACVRRLVDRVCEVLVILLCWLKPCRCQGQTQTHVWYLNLQWKCCSG